MKINKLFHWLYAILMLLPIFAIAVTCGYVIFNDNAYQSYYGDTINQTEIEPLTTWKIGERIYFNNTNSVNTTSQTGAVANTFITFTDLEIINRYDLNDTLANTILNSVKLGFYKVVDITYLTYFWYDNNNQSTGYSSTIKFEISFILTGYQFNTIDPINIYTNNPFSLRSFNEYSFLDNAFYYSLDEMKNNPLFSWANNNFLTNPFSYLFNLFGVPIDSGIMTLLSYWLDISIIWLVFDLIMYVPLLAHRWIDKGMID